MTRSELTERHVGAREESAKFCAKVKSWFYSGNKSPFWDEKDSQKALEKPRAYQITTPPCEFCAAVLSSR